MKRGLSLLVVAVIAVPVFAVTKAPIHTTIDPVSPGCPNGAWSVVYDSDNDGCYDRVNGVNCAGSTFTDSFSDTDCMVVSHDMGPWSGKITLGTFGGSSWRVELKNVNTGLVVGDMVKVSGEPVHFEWSAALRVGRLDNPSKEPLPSGVYRNGTNDYRYETSRELNETEKTAHQRVLEMMVGAKGRTISEEEAAATKLSVTVNGTSNESATISIAQAGNVRLDMIDVTTGRITEVHNGPLAAGTTVVQLPRVTASGQYLLRAASSSRTVTTFFVVTK